MLFFFFVSCAGDHPNLHVLTNPFPTRPSSDLNWNGSKVAVLRKLLDGCASSGRKRRRVRLGNSVTAILQQLQQPPGLDAERADIAGVGLPAISALSRLEEHTSELQSLMCISYAVFYLKKTTK